MRKFVAVVAASLVLSTVVAGTASAKPNARPHFVGSGMSISYDDVTGRAYLTYMIAGLGNGGYGYVKGHGKFTYSATCKKRNGDFFTNRVERLGVVNEHAVFADFYGNYPGTDPLHPSSICPNSSTFVRLDSWEWRDVAMELMSGPGGITYETWTYVAP